MVSSFSTYVCLVQIYTSVEEHTGIERGNSPHTPVLSIEPSSHSAIYDGEENGGTVFLSLRITLEAVWIQDLQQ